MEDLEAGQDQLLASTHLEVLEVLELLEVLEFLEFLEAL